MKVVGRWQAGVRKKVGATWKWWNFLEACLPESNTVLRMNLDETACKLYYKPAEGHLADGSVAATTKKEDSTPRCGRGPTEGGLESHGSGV